MVEVRNLRVDYDDVCAVRDLDLTVAPGEIYGLVGPNGAGKTTTLRALVGLVEPTYGDIHINGVDLDQHREAAVQVTGFMPDSAPIYDDLRVWEFLDLWAASYQVPRERRGAAIEQQLELVDLTGKRDALTAGLSRGMKQRLMLAKTLIPDPDVLLLDEPASGVDPYGRALLKDVMRRLGGEGKTVIISSHILSELSEFCTSVGIMEQGRMVVTGTVEEIAQRVLGALEVTMKVISGHELVDVALAQCPQVAAVNRDGSAYEFQFSGADEQAADLLAQLIGAGARVASFAPKKRDLESVFLKVGAREVM